MYFLYSIAYTIGFVLMLPAFLLNREKYSAGFRQRLGNYPKFKHDNREVIWLHCVSVGETNAARPLVDKLLEAFPDHRLVISTTTKTGQDVASKIFADKTDAIIYFPFDWKFSVRKASATYKPSLVLLMETEIWPRFIHEVKLSGAKVAIVNGRLSERSFRRYSKIRSFISRVLTDVDLAVMQAPADAKRIRELRIDESQIVVAGNLKFETTTGPSEEAITEQFGDRFGITLEKPLIVAASTHDPEERWLIEALDGKLGSSCRLLIAPRHPERFENVAGLLERSNYNFVRRTDAESVKDKTVDVILLDSIGELRAVYPLAEIVFVGGSLIPHGGQSILEPAAAGKAIIVGPFTHNFEAVVTEFSANRALLQLNEPPEEVQVAEQLSEAFSRLLENETLLNELGSNAAATMNANRDATGKTVESLLSLFHRNNE